MFFYIFNQQPLQLISSNVFDCVNSEQFVYYVMHVFQLIGEITFIFTMCLLNISSLTVYI